MTTATVEAVRELPLDSLIVDRRYQRPYDEDRAIKIAAEFNEVLCGVLDVAELPNGEYAVIDGQHRLGALRLLQHDEWWCKVNVLTSVEQAKAFVTFQQSVRRVHACDQHKAAVFAGEPLAVAVDNLVRDCGYQISNTGISTALTCATALAQAYDRYGPDVLRRSLRIISQSWGTDRTSRKAPIVLGMSLLIAKYPSDIDDDAFAHKLAEVPPARILREAASLRDGGASGTTGAILVARCLLNVVNKGRRRKFTPDRLGRGA